jgi:hypothetical protein
MELLKFIISISLHSLLFTLHNHSDAADDISTDTLSEPECFDSDENISTQDNITKEIGEG